MKKILLFLVSILFLTGCAELLNDDSNQFSSPVSQRTQEFEMMDEAQVSEGTNNSQQEIIYRSNIYYETVDYDQAKENLKSLVTDEMVVVSETESSTPSGDHSLRQLSMQIRVPQEDNQAVVDQLATLEAAETVRLQKGSEDVTKTIYDYEVRQDSIQARIDRLEELLDQAESVADMVEIEVALNEAILERDQILSELAYWEDQVAMSTIDITLQEVLTYQDGSQSQISVWDRILAYLGVLGGYILIALQYGIVAVFFLLPILIVVGIVLYIRRRRRKNKDQ